MVHPNNAIFSVIKRNELPSHIKLWRKLKRMFFGEKSHSEKATFCMIPIICHSGTGKIMKMLQRSVIVRSLEGRREE